MGMGLARESGDGVLFEEVHGGAQMELLGDALQDFGFRDLLAQAHFFYGLLEGARGQVQVQRVYFFVNVPVQEGLH